MFGVAAKAGAWAGRTSAVGWSHGEEGGLPDLNPNPAKLWHSCLGPALHVTRPLSGNTPTATQKGCASVFPSVAFCLTS